MNRKKSKKKCLSKKSQLHTDIQKTDEERLLELFTDVPYTPAAVRNTVGSHFVKRFMDIMTSPKAVEADWFALCGYMTSTQSQQYMHVTGDYAACKHELNILAIDIANHFQSQLIQLILNDIEGKRSLGIANLFERLHDLLYFRFEPIKGYQTYGHSLGMNFIMQVMSLIGVDLIYISINKNQNNTVRDGAQMFVERARTVFQKAFGIDFAGVGIPARILSAIMALRLQLVGHVLVGTARHHAQHAM